MKTKSTSLITKKLQKLNTIFHTLDQQSTSAITDVILLERVSLTISIQET